MSFGGFLNYTLLYDIPLDNEDRSLPAHSDIIMEVRRRPAGEVRVGVATVTITLLSHLQGSGRALRLSPPHLLFLSPLAGRLVSIAMVPQWFLDTHTGQIITRDDLLSVLADVTSLTVRVHLNTSAGGPVR